MTVWRITDSNRIVSTRHSISLLTPFNFITNTQQFVISVALNLNLIFNSESLFECGCKGSAFIETAKFISNIFCYYFYLILRNSKIILKKNQNKNLSNDQRPIIVKYIIPKKVPLPLFKSIKYFLNCMDY